ncbi:hypothetical protein [Pedobacter sp. JY14-1]|uniref:hypothetical protein n=1 Tax=Pedobacter sp. JY14-1 TaxID=3034151 RepID=UPI0023E266F4|nr:hypothetical protein [Pedobacter sp. JY14-1]
MQKIKTLHIYTAFAIIVTCYYAYTAWYGIAYWESSEVIRNTEYNSNRVRGAHSFYHK